MDRSGRVEKILSILKKEFPGAKIALNFSTPLELLIATILSAQCTDERVNATTPTLFKRYRKAEDYARADPHELESLLRSINFYKNKTRTIIKCCRKLVEEFSGDVPRTVEGLTSLPGVGRKTANIVLGNAFGRDAIAVDTHVKRVSKRLGFTDRDDPDDIEADLARIIPKKMWTRATHLLILHGRNICTSRNPRCDVCRIREYCRYYREHHPVS